MTQGMTNSAACEIVGVNRRTGNRWRFGRTYSDQAGRTYTDAPINEAPEEVSPRFLSEDERVTIADLLRAGRSIRAIARELDRLQHVGAGAQPGVDPAAYVDRLAAPAAETHQPPSPEHDWGHGPRLGF